MSALVALFVRSLRQDARSKITYWSRAGLILMLLFSLALIHTTSGWIGAPGLQFFSHSVFVNFFFISLAGLSYFASAITEENEEMTLGLLRMTNLNSLSILLGKSTSRLCGALLLLAAQFPFTFLAVAFGGVSVGQIVAAYCTLAAYLLFLSNLALLFSVIARRTAGAALFTGAVLFICLAGYAIFPAGLNLLAWMRLIPSASPGPQLGRFLEVWRSSSALERLGAILKTGFHEGPIGIQVISNIAAGGILFLIAWAAFNAFKAEQSEDGPARGPIVRPGSRLRWAGAGRAWRRAIVWKDFHFLAGGRVGTLIRFILYGVLLAFVLLNPSGRGRLSLDWPQAGFTMMGLMSVVLSFELTFAAGRIFRLEWRWKTLSGLAMLPMSLRSVAYQKIVAALFASWPGLLYFCIGLAFAGKAIWTSLGQALINSNSAWINPFLVTFGYLIVHLIFFLHLVANLSLRVKSGAVPLAFAISYISLMFIGTGAVLLGGLKAMLVPPLIYLVAAVVLHVNTGARLARLAAQE